MKIMKNSAIVMLLTIFCAACAQQTNTGLSQPREIVTDTGPEPISTQFWQEAVVSVTDIDRSAQFFIEIGGYEKIARGPLDASEIAYWGLPADASGETLLIAPADSPSGLVRLVRFDNAGKKEPTRPGARAWDRGCFASLMVRVKDMPSIYEDAIKMGWWSETPITYLEFDTSKLNVIIFRGPDGLQVQSYERLSPALPAAIPEFERVTRPFNMMQMVADKDASYRYYTQVLGFGTWHNGSPHLDKEPTYNPIGIPKNLTTSIPYQAAMVHPRPGEFGRIEMIEVMGIEGRDHSERCDAPNLGILSIKFQVDDINKARQLIIDRGGEINTDVHSIQIVPYGKIDVLNVKSPDGSIIEFYQQH